MLNLTTDQRKRIADEAKRELMRRSYRDYLVQVHYGRFHLFPHIELIAEPLQRIADGESLSVIIEMPPRHGKSQTVTETFPSYYIARNPTKRVIAAAYSDTLARKFGRLNRDKFNEAANVFGLALDANNSSAQDWSVSGLPGGMVATGIGGSITGQGADLLIIDDPIKNAEEANSPTMRQKVWDEWESTLSTRLHNGASVIVIMTRWHEDDLVGRLLENASRDWIRLRLPAIAEDDHDLLGRSKGDPLCRELGYDEEWAKQKKVEVGSRTWGALYQQRPAPDEGAIFRREWIQFYRKLPSELEYTVHSWDLTFKDSTGADNVSGQVWSKKGADRYLIDRVNGKMDFTATLRAIQSLKAKHSDYNAILIEDKANGPAVITTLRKQVHGIVPVNPEGGKIARAQAVSPTWEAGNVYLPHPDIAPWVHDYIEELISFPFATHDDDVDSTTQALAHLNRIKDKIRRDSRRLLF